ncbi:MAG: M28 family peptidase [Vicinamibacterales bacterium]|nr:hypothetical protein [Acidobacteriota bacterium]MDP7478738.1 M28 family peptidase [Vicinamibacterales bacterium]MDP7672780.1 M28 family peptidase [Vicinamibacterales bacterium]HJO39776.1 M28 family peptidase [Vicinamibacterales bacterium]
MRLRIAVGGLLVGGVLAGLVGPQVRAQEVEDRALLPWDQMRAIINEASGERAMHHVLELTPYPRVRPRAEYLEHFRESEVMARLAREYGLSNVEIESFPSASDLWQPTRGELWQVEPFDRKLYDIFDVAVSLAANSEAGELEATVVDVGSGARAEDYDGLDVAGKIVLGAAAAGTLQRLAIWERGAVGVLSYNSLRQSSYPDQIPSQRLAVGQAGQATGFGWSIAPRVARDLAATIARGEEVTLRSVVETESFPGELEVVHAEIPGDGSTDQEIVVSAHLYEGYIKQGANDDTSGCALTLEIARAYLRLIESGALPRPRRTIHFLWVPEISGTNAWLDAHPDIEERLVADLNFDMEGVRLATSASAWVLHRTPDTFPSFLNDVAQNMMEFVAAINRERIRFRTNGYNFTWPVVSPNGSRDPFYIQIAKHYGASDHVVYLGRGIPSVMFITWPDMWYHSSQDTPDKLDPTQFKRAAVVGIGSMSVLASAEDRLASTVAGESLSRGTERLGEAERKALAYLAEADSHAALHVAYKEAHNTVRHQSAVERAVIRSVAVLFADAAEGARQVSALEKVIGRREATMQDGIETYYRLRADLWGVRPAGLTLTDAEQRASDTTVGDGPNSTGGVGIFARRAAMAALTSAQREALTAAEARIPQHMRAELRILLREGRSALAIRDFLSGEFDPLALDILLGYLRVQEDVGFVSLTVASAAGR